MKFPGGILNKFTTTAEDADTFAIKIPEVSNIRSNNII